MWIVVANCLSAAVMDRLSTGAQSECAYTVMTIATGARKR